MPKRKSPLLRVLNEIGPLVAGMVAAVLVVAVIAPAAAQFFPFSRPPAAVPQQRQPSPFGGFPFFSPFEQPAPRPQVRVDNSRAPAPEKPDTIPERNVLVIGDAMADWLGYGLEQAFEDQPDMGVIRKHRTVSGLIRYQPRGERSDWAAAAKGIIAAEKADAIVVMLGLHDRTSIREPVPEKNEAKPDAKADPKKKSDAKAAARSDAAKQGDGAKPNAAPSGEAKPGDKADKTADAEQSPDDGDDPPPGPILAEKSARTPNGVYEFRDSRWVELYNRKIDELIAVLKTKGVPVLWVGLPAVRGPKATSDVLFLDSLYREGAAKANITYVDVWDGFVDEGGRFLNQGPDFEGQTRRLRSADGVYFTKTGARKLAHYVDRELKRLMANRPAVVSLPSEPAVDDEAEPGKPAPRPLVGPAMPLVAAAISTNELLGGSGTRPAPVDPLAARTLVKGEPLAAPPGRADDYSWPRREVGSMESAKDPAVASAGPDDAPAAAPKPAKRRPRPAVANPNLQPNAPSSAPAANGWPSFFGGRPAAPVQSQPPQRPGGPRPPATIGRSASVPQPQPSGGWFGPFSR